MRDALSALPEQPRGGILHEARKNSKLERLSISSSSFPQISQVRQLIQLQRIRERDVRTGNFPSVGFEKGWEKLKEATASAQQSTGREGTCAWTHCGRDTGRQGGDSHGGRG